MTMTPSLICIPIAFLLIYASKLPLAVAMHREGKSQGKGYDNRHPRDQQARLTGWGRRANAAHYNGFESFPGFAAGALVANVAGGDPWWATALAIGYLVTRVLYIGFYLGDVHFARSSSWFLGLACILGLFALPLLG